MLSIRMQRLGRKGHPTYRVVVQDSRQAPTSGKYVALLGSYDPHTKASTIQKDKAEFYLNNGAQPSDRVVSLFKSEKVTLPKWVKEPSKQERSIKNPDKLRKNRPDEPVVAEEAPASESEEAPVEAETTAEETPSEDVAEAPSEESQDSDPNPADEAKEEPAEKPEAEKTA